MGKMVGAVRFELTTSCTRNKRASQATLRPVPREQKVPVVAAKCNLEFHLVVALRKDALPRDSFGLSFLL